MKDIITITGDIGSGKSTIARILERSLGFKSVTTGAIQREIAARKQMTSLQLNEQSMKDRAVDDTIDSYLMQLNAGGDRLILDSRLAWHFVKGAFNVYVSVDPRVGAERVLAHHRREEVHHDAQDAMRNDLRRRALEIARFAGLYGIHCDDLRQYSLVVDSTWAAPEAVADIVMDSFRGRDSSAAIGRICPKSLYPTQGARSLESPETEALLASMTARGYDPAFPIEAIRFSEYFFIFDGHKRARCALRLGLQHVPCALRAADDETAAKGKTYKDIITSALAQTWIHDWETAHQFSFASKPDADGQPQFGTV